MTVYIDGDGCTVKNETYKVALRHQVKVIVVANTYLNVPMDINIAMEVVSGDFDAADDWIVENIESGDILITSDILLAERSIQKGARVLGQKGHELDEENIGGALANRELNSHLRNLGTSGTGPSAMKPADRSRFLGKLDQLIHAQKKRK